MARVSVKEEKKEKPFKFKVGETIRLKRSSLYYKQAVENGYQWRLGEGKISKIDGRYYVIDFVDSKADYFAEASLERCVSLHKKGQTVVVNVQGTPIKKGTEVKILKVVNSWCICEDKTKQRWAYEDVSLTDKE